MREVSLVISEDATATLGEFISSFGTFAGLGVMIGLLYGVVVSLLVPCFFCVPVVTVPMGCGGGGWILDYLAHLIKTS